MRKSDIFRGELDLISNHKYRECAREILDELVPDYFYDVPASSTGKYHPWYSLGYGGLVRHTKAAFKIAKDLLNLKQYEALDEDAILVAILLHDTFKHGVPPMPFTVSEHPVIAAENIRAYAHKNFDEEMAEGFDYVAELIASHMGQWNKTKSMEMPVPETPAQKFVHLCDYLASRKYIIVEVQ